MVWGEWKGLGRSDRQTDEERQSSAPALPEGNDQPLTALHGCWLCCCARVTPQGMTVATQETGASTAAACCVHSSRSACPSLFKNKYSQRTLAGGSVNRYCLSEGNMKHFRKCLRM